TLAFATSRPVTVRVNANVYCFFFVVLFEATFLVLLLCTIFFVVLCVLLAATFFFPVTFFVVVFFFATVAVFPCSLSAWAWLSSPASTSAATQTCDSFLLLRAS